MNPDVLGCGTGEFSRLLAPRAGHVVGLDVSPNMIRVARARSAHLTNVEFHATDICSWPFPIDAYDCIATIATLHHLPMEQVLAQARSALRPGGTLLVLDLFEDRGVAGFIARGSAFSVDKFARLVRTGRWRPPPAARRLWDQHARGDRYPGLDDVERICRDLFPEARVRRHFFWRYSIVWRKPARGVDLPAKGA